jgi:tyrosyl-tRNA synthetase
MTMPLLTGTDGQRKMSKSFGNYIGVTDPPNDIYGKTMSIPDEVLPLWYALLLGSEPPPGVGPRDAKRELARRLVARFHGEEAARGAEEAFDRQFVRHEAPAEVREVQWKADGGVVHLPALLSHAFGISTSEARRTITQGGVKLDGAALPDGSLDRPASEVDGKLVQLGKRRFVRVKVV